MCCQLCIVSSNKAHTPGPRARRAFTFRNESAINVFCPPAYSEELQKTRHLFSDSAFRACFFSKRGGGGNHWSDIISHLPGAVLPHFRNLQQVRETVLTEKKMTDGNFGIKKMTPNLRNFSPPQKSLFVANFFSVLLVFFSPDLTRKWDVRCRQQDKRLPKEIH